MQSIKLNIDFTIRHKNVGYTFDEFLQIYDKRSKPSDFGKHNTRVYDKETRNSRILDHCKLNIKNYEIVDEWKDFTINDKAIDVDESIQTFTKTCEIIKYEKNCYFKEHHDRLREKNHIATTLLYPPLKLIDYEGGELKVQEHIIKPDNEYWTLIVMDISCIHESLPITNGFKMIFKSELHIDDYVSPLYKGECYLCLELLVDDLIELKCGDVYHKTCLTQHMKKSNECPLCNYKIYSKAPEPKIKKLSDGHINID